jgi:hypothetical protein
LGEASETDMDGGDARADESDGEEDKREVGVSSSLLIIEWHSERSAQFTPEIIAASEKGINQLSWHLKPLSAFHIIYLNH